MPYPTTWSDSSDLAVIMMIGMSRVRSPARSSRQMASPSRVGSMMSSRIRSGRSVWAFRSPSWPSWAGMVSYPSRAKYHVRDWTSPRSSSMIRTRGWDMGGRGKR